MRSLSRNTLRGVHRGSPPGVDDGRRERIIEMKKYYADIYHAKSGAHITIGEYSEKAIEKSIAACIKQRGFEPDDCIWLVRTEQM